MFKNQQPSISFYEIVRWLLIQIKQPPDDSIDRMKQTVIVFLKTVKHMTFHHVTNLNNTIVINPHPDSPPIYYSVLKRKCYFIYVHAQL